MQEFSSVTASSYDAEALAPMLTEKAAEGWSVVAIVSAGTNVVAYLSRGGTVATSATASPEDAVVTPIYGTSTADVTAEPIAEEVATGYVATEDVAAEEVAASWESTAVDHEITAITPTLPGETITPVAEPEPVHAAADVEAAAAVVATGEPVGWGASADDVASAAGDASSNVADQSGATVGGYATGASDVLGGVSEHAGAVAGGYADTASSVTDTIGGAAETASDVVGGETTQTADAGQTTEAAAVVESSGVPAGWYADPSGRFELRYWDGNAWTEHVSRAGQQYTDPPVA